MKKNEIKITVTFGQVLNAPYWNSWHELCENYGINEWCLNEGLARSDDTIEISLEHAKLWGLIK